MACESKCATCLLCLNSNSLSHHISSLPSHIASHIARTTTCKNDDGVVPRPHHLSGCRELVLSASRCSPRVVLRLALYPQSKYLSPLSCLANLLDPSVTQALRAMPAPPSCTGSQAWCVFFFSLSIPADLQYSFATSPPVPRPPDQPPRTVSRSSSVNDAVLLAQRAGQAVNGLPPQVTPR